MLGGIRAITFSNQLGTAQESFFEQRTFFTEIAYTNPAEPFLLQQPVPPVPSVEGVVPGH